MAALPYMQLYPADYLSDTMHLTTEEHGAYFLIILNYWQTGKPIHKSKMCGITRLSNERWTDVERTLNEFFEITDSGLWVHHRIEYDLTKVNSKRVQASRAGVASAKKRALLKVVENNGESNGRSTDVQHELNPTLNHKDTDTDTDTDKRKSIKRKTTIPLNFKPSSANIEYAGKNSIDIAEVVEQFKTNAIAKNVMYIDWHAGLRTWLLKRKQWAKEKQIKNDDCLAHDATDDVNWI